MTRTAGPPIVVGVDGTAEGLRAVDFARVEALRTSSPVQLVHAYREMLPSPLLATYDVLTSREAGVAALEEARARLASSPVTVTLRLIEGGARDVLPQATDGARLLVIGRSPLHGVEKMLAGSAVTSICARSTVPVASVPLSWEGAPRRPVVVGMIDESSEAALSVGFEQAHLLGVPLRALRAWEPPLSWSTEAPVSHEEIEASWAADTQRTLADELAPWRVAYPTVPVQEIVSIAAPSRALLDAAEGAQIVVVAARRSMEVLHPRLGSTARKLLAHASCPVIVAPPGNRARHSAYAKRPMRATAPDLTLPLY